LTIRHTGEQRVTESFEQPIFERLGAQDRLHAVDQQSATRMRGRRMPLVQIDLDHTLARNRLRGD
jgi:hypothetical protein